MGLTTSVVELDAEQVLPPILVDNDHLWQDKSYRLGRRSSPVDSRRHTSECDLTSGEDHLLVGRLRRDTWHPCHITPPLRSTDPCDSRSDKSIRGVVSRRPDIERTTVAVRTQDFKVAIVPSVHPTVHQELRRWRRRSRSGAILESSSTDPDAESFAIENDSRQRPTRWTAYPWLDRSKETVSTVKAVVCSSSVDGPLLRVSKTQSTVNCETKQPQSAEFSATITVRTEAVADPGLSLPSNGTSSLRLSQRMNVPDVVVDPVGGCCGSTAAPRSTFLRGSKITEQSAILPHIDNSNLILSAESATIAQTSVNRDFLRSKCERKADFRLSTAVEMHHRSSLPESLVNTTSQSKRVSRKRRNNSDPCLITQVTEILSNETKMSGECVLVQFHDPLSARNIDDVNKPVGSSVRRIRKQPVVDWSKPLSMSTRDTCKPEISEPIKRSLRITDNSGNLPTANRTKVLTGVETFVDVIVEPSRSSGREDNSVNNDLMIVDVNQYSTKRLAHVRQSPEKGVESEERFLYQPSGDERRNARRAVLRDTRVYGFDINPDYLEQLAIKGQRRRSCIDDMELVLSTEATLGYRLADGQRRPSYDLQLIGLQPPGTKRRRMVDGPSRVLHDDQLTGPYDVNFRRAELNVEIKPTVSDPDVLTTAMVVASTLQRPCNNWNSSMTVVSETRDIIRDGHYQGLAKFFSSSDLNLRSARNNYGMLITPSDRNRIWPTREAGWWNWYHNYAPISSGTNVGQRISYASSSFIDLKPIYRSAIRPRRTVILRTASTRSAPYDLGIYGRGLGSSNDNKERDLSQRFGQVVNSSRLGAGIERSHDYQITSNYGHRDRFARHRATRITELNKPGYFTRVNVGKSNNGSVLNVASVLNRARKPFQFHPDNDDCLFDANVQSSLSVPERRTMVEAKNTNPSTSAECDSKFDHAFSKPLRPFHMVVKHTENIGRVIKQAPFGLSLVGASTTSNDLSTLKQSHNEADRAFSMHSRRNLNGEFESESSGTLDWMSVDSLTEEYSTSKCMMTLHKVSSFPEMIYNPFRCCPIGRSLSTGHMSLIREVGVEAASTESITYVFMDRARSVRSMVASDKHRRHKRTQSAFIGKTDHVLKSLDDHCKVRSLSLDTKSFSECHRSSRDDEMNDGGVGDYESSINTLTPNSDNYNDEVMCDDDDDDDDENTLTNRESASEEKVVDNVRAESEEDATAYSDDHNTAECGKNEMVNERKRYAKPLFLDAYPRKVLSIDDLMQYWQKVVDRTKLSSVVSTQRKSRPSERGGIPECMTEATQTIYNPLCCGDMATANLPKTYERFGGGTENCTQGVSSHMSKASLTRYDSDMEKQQNHLGKDVPVNSDPPSKDIHPLLNVLLKHSKEILSPNCEEDPSPVEEDHLLNILQIAANIYRSSGRHDRRQFATETETNKLRPHPGSAPVNVKQGNDWYKSSAAHVLWPPHDRNDFKPNELVAEKRHQALSPAIASAPADEVLPGLIATQDDKQTSARASTQEQYRGSVAITDVYDLITTATSNKESSTNLMREHDILAAMYELSEQNQAAADTQHEYDTKGKLKAVNIPDESEFNQQHNKLTSFSNLNYSSQLSASELMKEGSDRRKTVKDSEFTCTSDHQVPNVTFILSTPQQKPHLIIQDEAEIRNEGEIRYASEKIYSELYNNHHHDEHSCVTNLKYAQSGRFGYSTNIEVDATLDELEVGGMVRDNCYSSDGESTCDVPERKLEYGNTSEKEHKTFTGKRRLQKCSSGLPEQRLEKNGNDEVKTVGQKVSKESGGELVSMCSVEPLVEHALLSNNSCSVVKVNDCQTNSRTAGAQADPSHVNSVAYEINSEPTDGRKYGTAVKYKTARNIRQEPKIVTGEIDIRLGKLSGINELVADGGEVHQNILNSTFEGTTETCEPRASKNRTTSTEQEYGKQPCDIESNLLSESSSEPEKEASQRLHKTMEELRLDSPRDMCETKKGSYVNEHITETKVVHKEDSTVEHTAGGKAVHAMENLEKSCKGTAKSRAQRETVSQFFFVQNNDTNCESDKADCKVNVQQLNVYGTMVGETSRGLDGVHNCGLIIHSMSDGPGQMGGYDKQNIMNVKTVTRNTSVTINIPDHSTPEHSTTYQSPVVLKRLLEKSCTDKTSPDLSGENSLLADHSKYYSSAAAFSEGNSALADLVVENNFLADAGEVRSSSVDCEGGYSSLAASGENNGISATPHEENSFSMVPGEQRGFSTGRSEKNSSLTCHGGKLPGGAILQTSSARKSPVRIFETTGDMEPDLQVADQQYRTDGNKITETLGHNAFGGKQIITEVVAQNSSGNRNRSLFLDQTVSSQFSSEHGLGFTFVGMKPDIKPMYEYNAELQCEPNTRSFQTKGNIPISSCTNVYEENRRNLSENGISASCNVDGGFKNDTTTVVSEKHPQFMCVQLEDSSLNRSPSKAVTTVSSQSQPLPSAFDAEYCTSTANSDLLTADEPVCRLFDELHSRSTDQSYVNLSNSSTKRDGCDDILLHSKHCGKISDSESDFDDPVKIGDVKTLTLNDAALQLESGNGNKEMELEGDMERHQRDETVFSYGNSEPSETWNMVSSKIMISTPSRCMRSVPGANENTVPDEHLIKLSGDNSNIQFREISVTDKNVNKAPDGERIIMPCDSSKIQPGETRNSVPGEHRTIVPDENRITVSDESCDIQPGETRNSVPGEHGTIVPDENRITVSGDSSDIQPGETRNSVPGEHGTILPDENRITVSGESSDIQPGETRNKVPGEHGTIVLDGNRITVSDDSSDIQPGETRDKVPGEHGTIVPDENRITVSGDSSDIQPGETRNSVPGEHGTIVPDGNSITVSDDSSDIQPDETRNRVPGEHGPIVPDEKRIIVYVNNSNILHGDGRNREAGENGKSNLPGGNGNIVLYEGWISGTGDYSSVLSCRNKMSLPEENENEPLDEHSISISSVPGLIGNIVRHENETSRAEECSIILPGDNKISVHAESTIEVPDENWIRKVSGDNSNIPVEKNSRPHATGNIVTREKKISELGDYNSTLPAENGSSLPDQDNNIMPCESWVSWPDECSIILSGRSRSNLFGENAYAVPDKNKNRIIDDINASLCDENICIMPDVRRNRLPGENSSIAPDECSKIMPGESRSSLSDDKMNLVSGTNGSSIPGANEIKILGDDRSDIPGKISNTLRGGIHINTSSANKNTMSGQNQISTPYENRNKMLVEYNDRGSSPVENSSNTAANLEVHTALDDKIVEVFVPFVTVEFSLVSPIEAYTLRNLSAMMTSAEQNENADLLRRIELLDNRSSAQVSPCDSSSPVNDPYSTDVPVSTGATAALNSEELSPVHIRRKLVDSNGECVGSRLDCKSDDIKCQIPGYDEEPNGFFVEGSEPLITVNLLQLSSVHSDQLFHSPSMMNGDGQLEQLGESNLELNGKLSPKLEPNHEGIERLTFPIRHSTRTMYNGDFRLRLGHLTEIVEPQLQSVSLASDEKLAPNQLKNSGWLNGMLKGDESVSHANNTRNHVESVYPKSSVSCENSEDNGASILRGELGIDNRHNDTFVEQFENTSKKSSLDTCYQQQDNSNILSSSLQRDSIKSDNLVSNAITLHSSADSNVELEFERDEPVLTIARDTTAGDHHVWDKSFQASAVSTAQSLPRNISEVYELHIREYWSLVTCPYSNSKQSNFESSMNNQFYKSTKTSDKMSSLQDDEVGPFVKLETMSSSDANSLEVGASTHTPIGQSNPGTTSPQLHSFTSTYEICDHSTASSEPFTSYVRNNSEHELPDTSNTCQSNENGSDSDEPIDNHMNLNPLDDEFVELSSAVSEKVDNYNWNATDKSINSTYVCNTKQPARTRFSSSTPIHEVFPETIVCNTSLVSTQDSRTLACDVALSLLPKAAMLEPEKSVSQTLMPSVISPLLSSHMLSTSAPVAEDINSSVSRHHGVDLPSKGSNIPSLLKAEIILASTNDNIILELESEAPSLLGSGQPLLVSGSVVTSPSRIDEWATISKPEVDSSSLNDNGLAEDTHTINLPLFTSGASMAVQYKALSPTASIEENNQITTRSENPPSPIVRADESATSDSLSPMQDGSSTSTNNLSPSKLMQRVQSSPSTGYTASALDPSGSTSHTLHLSMQTIVPPGYCSPIPPPQILEVNPTAMFEHFPSASQQHGIHSSVFRNLAASASNVQVYPSDLSFQTSHSITAPQVDIPEQAVINFSALSNTHESQRSNIRKCDSSGTDNINRFDLCDDVATANPCRLKEFSEPLPRDTWLLLSSVLPVCLPSCSPIVELQNSTAIRGVTPVLSAKSTAKVTWLLMPQESGHLSSDLHQITNRKWPELAQQNAEDVFNSGQNDDTFKKISEGLTVDNTNQTSEGLSGSEMEKLNFETPPALTYVVMWETQPSVIGKSVLTMLTPRSDDKNGIDNEVLLNHPKHSIVGRHNCVEPFAVDADFIPSEFRCLDDVNFKSQYNHESKLIAYPLREFIAPIFVENWENIGAGQPGASINSGIASGNMVNGQPNTFSPKVVSDNYVEAILNQRTDEPELAPDISRVFHRSHGGDLQSGDKTSEPLHYSKSYDSYSVDNMPEILGCCEVADYPIPATTYFDVLTQLNEPKCIGATDVLATTHRTPTAVLTDQPPIRSMQHEFESPVDYTLSIPVLHIVNELAPVGLSPEVSSYTSHHVPLIFHVQNQPIPLEHVTTEKEETIGIHLSNANQLPHGRSDISPNSLRGDNAGKYSNTVYQQQQHDYFSHQPEHDNKENEGKISDKVTLQPRNSSSQPPKCFEDNKGGHSNEVNHQPIDSSSWQQKGLEGDKRGKYSHAANQQPQDSSCWRPKDEKEEIKAKGSHGKTTSRDNLQLLDSSSRQPNRVEDNESEHSSTANHQPNYDYRRQPNHAEEDIKDEHLKTADEAQDNSSRQSEDDKKDNNEGFENKGETWTSADQSLQEIHDRQPIGFAYDKEDKKQSKPAFPKPQDYVSWRQRKGDGENKSGTTSCEQPPQDTPSCQPNSSEGQIKLAPSSNAYQQPHNSSMKPGKTGVENKGEHSNSTCGKDHSHRQPNAVEGDIKGEHPNTTHQHPHDFSGRRSKHNGEPGKEGAGNKDGTPSSHDQQLLDISGQQLENEGRETLHKFPNRTDQELLDSLCRRPMGTEEKDNIEDDKHRRTVRHSDYNRRQHCCNEADETALNCIVCQQSAMKRDFRQNAHQCTIACDDQLTLGTTSASSKLFNVNSCRHHCLMETASHCNCCHHCNYLDAFNARRFLAPINDIDEETGVSKKNMCIVGRRPGQFCAYCGSRLANQMCPICDHDFPSENDDVKLGLDYQLLDAGDITSKTFPVDPVHSGKHGLFGSRNAGDESGNSRRSRSVGRKTSMHVDVDDELERLRRDRQKIVDMLAKDYVPSKFEVEKTEAELNYLSGQMDSIWTSVDDPTSGDHISMTRRDMRVPPSSPHEVEIVLNVISKKYLKRYRSTMNQDIRLPAPLTTSHIRGQVIDNRRTFEPTVGGGGGSTRSSSPSGDSGLDQTFGGRTSRSRSFGASTLSLNSAGGISSGGAFWNGGWTPSEGDGSGWSTAMDDMSWMGGPPSPPSSFNGGSRWWWPRRRMFDMWGPHYSQLRPFRRFTGSTGLLPRTSSASTPSRRRSDGGFGSTLTRTTTVNNPTSSDDSRKQPSSAPKTGTDNTASSTSNISSLSSKAYSVNDLGETPPGMVISRSPRNSCAGFDTFQQKSPHYSAKCIDSVQLQQQTQRMKQPLETGQTSSSRNAHITHNPRSTSASVTSLPPLPTRPSSAASSGTTRRHRTSTASNASDDNTAGPSFSVHVIQGSGKKAMSSSLSSLNVVNPSAERINHSTSETSAECLVMVVGNRELDNESHQSSGGIPPLQITIDDADDHSSTISLSSCVPTSPSSPAPDAPASISNLKRALHRRTISHGGAIPFQLEVTFSPSLYKAVSDDNVSRKQCVQLGLSSTGSNTSSQVEMNKTESND